MYECHVRGLEENFSPFMDVSVDVRLTSLINVSILKEGSFSIFTRFVFLGPEAFLFYHTMCEESVLDLCVLSVFCVFGTLS